MPQVIYIHGFTSHPGTSKGAFFSQKLAQHGIELILPDFNVPTFETLTLTAQIEKLAAVIHSLPDEPVYLIGSSMGGGVTVHFMNTHLPPTRQIEKIVLLAPALDFIANRQKQLGTQGLKEWQARGYLPVRHYADGQLKHLHYGLMEDLYKYDSYAVRYETPTLLIHGKQDESVDYRQSVRFAETRPHVRLELVDSDHSLESAFDQMWALIEPFFIPRQIP